MPLVDIRDVVEAHIEPAKRDEAAGKWFLLVKSGDGEISMPETYLVCGIHGWCPLMFEQYEFNESSWIEM